MQRAHADATRISDVRRPSIDQYNPAKLTDSLCQLLDRNAPLARLDAGTLLERLKKVEKENVVAFEDEDSTSESLNHGPADSPTKPALTKKLSSIRLVHLASGRVKEVLITTSKYSSATEVEERDLDLDNNEDIDVKNITRVIRRNVRGSKLTVSFADGETDDVPGIRKSAVCEAVLRSVLAPKSLDEVDKAEQETLVKAVRDLFALSESQFDNAERRAIYGARYRRAELKAKYRAVNRDRDTMVDPDQFDDTISYETWKEQELDDISRIIVSLGGELPPFSGSVQLVKIAAYHLKPAKWLRRLQCNRGHSSFQVYYTVKVIPSRSKSFAASSPSDPDEDVANSMQEPAFTSKVVVCKGSADWQGESPWITVSSMQDQILIEFWERKEINCVRLKTAKTRIGHVFPPQLACGMPKRRRRLKKVAPRNGDLFLGQKFVNFSHIERQALVDGEQHGTAPEELENLADAKNRDSMSVVQMNFACFCKHDSRDAPPHESLLKSPVEDIGKAYEYLLQIAFEAETAEYELGEEWQRITENFAAHYRIRKERCRLSLVFMLAGKFKPIKCYLTAIVDRWSSVCAAAREGQLTKDELAIHSDIAGTKPAEEALRDFHTTFPENQPPGAMSKLLELLALILCWEPSPIEILIPLRGWIEDSCEKRLRSKLFYNADGEKQEEISLQSLIDTVKLVRSDITEHETVYQVEFPPEFILSAVTAPLYYRLVIQYTKSFVDSVTMKTFTKEYGELASELLSLQKDITKTGVKLTFADIHELFAKNISEWLMVMEPRMFDFVMNSCSGEKWEPLTKNTSMTETTFLYSGSVIDLYWMMTEYVDELTSRLLILPSGLQYVWHIEAGICAAVQLYVGRLEKLCLRNLPQGQEGEKAYEDHEESDSDTEPNTLSHCISMSLCVKLNNINEVIQRQQELESYLDKRLQRFVPAVAEDDNLSIEEDLETEDRFQSINDYLAAKHKVGEKFKDLRKVIHHTYNNVIGSIVERMQGRLKSELQKVLRRANLPAAEDHTVEDQLDPLTSYMDENIVVMNDWLHPIIFKRLLKEIAKALFFCMEEFVLNKDEDPEPMTLPQRELLSKVLTELYDYFDGYGQSNGRGLSSAQTHQACARLRKILDCWDLNTRHLCTQYWPAWVKFNDYMFQKQESKRQIGYDSKDSTLSSSSSLEEPLDQDVELHVLDYLLLLKQRRDDEARELVGTQSLIATEKTTQFIFGLPRDEEIIASFACRGASRKDGTLHITTHNVAFAENNVVAAHDSRLFVLSFERLMSVHVKGDQTVVLVPFNLRPRSFTHISDPDAVARTIFDQVAGSGTYLEKSMSPSFVEGHRLSGKVIKEYHCSKRHGVIRQLRGKLLVSTTHVSFEPMEILKQEKESLDFGSIASVVERHGVRGSCVMIELKYGGNVEFVDFTDADRSLADIVREIEKLVFG